VVPQSKGQLRRRPAMPGRDGSAGSEQQADVFVIFGITGDLAKVMTFRSLYRLEQRIGEPQVQDLLEPQLSEVVVDPIQLRLIDVLVEFLGQGACRCQVVAEGFSTTTRPVLVRPAWDSPLMAVANRNGGISR